MRLLLDDNPTFGMDERLAALDAHPNIEVRLFNPFKFRFWRVFEYIADFRRINRRMHNKSFTVDNQVTVIGGRNIGDEYFAASDQGTMYDLDALAIGDVVQQVSDDFDRYWASDSSFPASLLLPKPQATAIAAFREDAVRLEGGRAAVAYRKALSERSQVRSLMRGELPLDWATTHLVSDDPAKALGPGPRNRRGLKFRRCWIPRKSWASCRRTSCLMSRAPTFCSIRPVRGYRFQS